MVTIRHERLHDMAPREALLDHCLGAARRAKASERLREGRLPWLALVAIERGRVIGTVRLWHVSAGPGPALLLGPLAVDARHRNRGVGSALVQRAIEMARADGHREILLVGDAPYYNRFGFSAERTAKLVMPGPFERARLLSLALTPVKDEPTGLIAPTGVAAASPAAALAVPTTGVERRQRRRTLVRAA